MPSFLMALFAFLFEKTIFKNRRTPPPDPDTDPNWVKIDPEELSNYSGW